LFDRLDIIGTVEPLVTGTGWIRLLYICIEKCFNTKPCNVRNSKLW